MLTSGAGSHSVGVPTLLLGTEDSTALLALQAVSSPKPCPFAFDLTGKTGGEILAMLSTTWKTAHVLWILCSHTNMLQHEATLRRWLKESTCKPHSGYKNPNKGRLHLRACSPGDLLWMALLFLLLSSCFPRLHPQPNPMSTQDLGTSQPALVPEYVSILKSSKTTGSLMLK